MYYKQLYSFLTSCMVLLVAACNNNTSTTAEALTDSTVKVQSVINEADSIDKANAATIESEGPEVQKAMLNMEDSTIWVVVNKYRDHRIFGYNKPDQASKRMLLFSIFTNDVEKNPFRCPYGAYYENSDSNCYNLKFIGNEGSFMKVMLLKKEKSVDSVYMEKKWVEIDKGE